MRRVNWSFNRWATNRGRHMPESEQAPGAVTNFLTQQIYPDLKIIIPSIIRKLTIPVKKVNAQRFKSPEDLLEALKSNKVKNDTFVSIECKPSTFGPFLRNHFLSALSGVSSDMMLGPRPQSNFPEIPEFGFIAQLSSYLKPVGLYPPINKELTQVTLYPSDTPSCGYIGLMPGTSKFVTSMPAIVSQDKISLCGASSIVMGIVRMVTQAMCEEKGIPVEVYEELRQSGDIWYLDIYSQGTEIKPMHDAVITEMWGGLYASGHIEAEGEMYVNPVLRGVTDAFSNAGYKSQHVNNFAGNQEHCIFAQGLRFSIIPAGAIYSLHMDAEIAINYKRNRRIFDGLCDNILEVLIDSAKNSGATLKNPKDLDFTYTDSAKSFSILESKSADEISDPTAIIVRDWHRKKNV